MTVLVIGRSGQLARHLHDRLSQAVFLSRAELDLSISGVEQRVLEQRPSLVINAAAYTQVDRAESEPEVAWRVNVDGAAAIARAAAQLKVPLIHVSTDYVFDGSRRTPYHENDPVRPLSVYGRTKLAGELAIMDRCPSHWIVRTSWVFSEFGSNFVKTMLRLASERSELRVVDDQFGRPTYAGDLADLIVRLSERLAEGTRVRPGTYHVGGGDVVSWREFADAIFAEACNLGLLARPPIVRGIATAEYPAPATRPPRAVLAPSRALLRALAARPPDWRIGLRKTLRGLHLGT
jgi:dTDP-4-dehydrorhamnose reductase